MDKFSGFANSNLTPNPSPGGEGDSKYLFGGANVCIKCF